MPFPEDLHHQVEVPRHDPNPVLDARFWRQHPRLHQRPRPHEDPRIIKSPTPHAHPCTPRLRLHVHCRLGRRHVAIANHRDRPRRLHHLANARKIHRAREPLLPGPPMNKYPGDAGILQRPDQVWGCQIVVIPTQAHLGRHRDTQRIHHRPHQMLRPFVLHHHRRTATHPTHLAHRASHVDVDGTHPPLLQHHRRIAHLLGHGTEQLHRQRPIVLIGFNELEGLGIFLDERPRVDQIGRRQIEAPNLPRHQTERQVRVARQRRQKQVGLQLQRAETNHPRRLLHQRLKAQQTVGEHLNVRTSTRPHGPAPTISARP